MHLHILSRSKVLEKLFISKVRCLELLELLELESLELQMVELLELLTDVKFVLLQRVQLSNFTSEG